jgi:hypothetical protein
MRYQLLRDADRDIARGQRRAGYEQRGDDREKAA